MINVVRNLAKSRLMRLLLSAILIYFAFRRINIGNLVNEIRMVPIGYVLAILFYIFMVMLIGGWRWSILLLDKPKLNDVWTFTKATYRGSFYGLFFPTAMAGDLLKWLPLKEKYPHLSRTQIASSVLIDRIVGFCAFGVMAFLSMILGKILKYQFPDYLLWLFGFINLGMLAFFVLINKINFNKIFGRYQKLDRLLEIISILKDENKGRLFKAIAISIVGEPIWQLPFWFYSLIFGTGVSLLQVLIFLPIISLILVLPISVAGFGARENLFLYFFVPLGFSPEKILVLSTFGGLMGILNSLIGGLFLIF